MGKDIPHPPEPSVEQTEREQVLMALYGSRAGIRRMIHWLHRLNVAQPGEWSHLFPVPDQPGKLMSVLQRQI